MDDRSLIGNFQRYLTLRGKFQLESAIVGVKVLSFRKGPPGRPSPGRQQAGTAAVVFCRGLYQPHNVPFSASVVDIIVAATADGMLHFHESTGQELLTYEAGHAAEISAIAFDSATVPHLLLCDTLYFSRYMSLSTWRLLHCTALYSSALCSTGASHSGRPPAYTHTSRPFIVSPHLTSCTCLHRSAPCWSPLPRMAVCGCTSSP